MNHVNSATYWQPRRFEPKQCLYVLLFLCITVNWLIPLPTSLWLDETVTFWATKDSFSQMLNRTTELQFFSLFFWVDWLAAKTGAINEIILRLPSVLAMLSALAVLYRIGQELYDEETALYAVLLFAAHPLISFEAHNARPYALGLLLVVTAMLYFIRWLEAENLRDGLLFAFFSGLAIYVHPFFGESLLICGSITLSRIMNGKVSDRINLIAIWGSMFIFLLPAAWLNASILARSHSLVWSATPTNTDFFLVLLPTCYFAVLIAGSIIGLILRARLTPIPSKCGRSAVLLAYWILVPVCTIFLISRFTASKIFEARYLITIVPGVALFLAASIRSLNTRPANKNHSGFIGIMNPDFVKGALLTIVVSISIAMSLVEKNWISREDWRSAIQTAQSYLGNDDATIPVFFDSGLVESRQIDWLYDSAKTSYLLAPLAAYPLKGKVFPLPYSMEDGISKQYSLDLLNHVSGRQCIFIGRRSNFEFRMEKSFGAIAEKLGYSKRYIYNHPKAGRPFVMLLER